MNLPKMKNNYQLYHTNVLLGGQMKWDIILNSFQGRLLVEDFHITPINNRVPYNRYSQESLLNYTHLENIKKYYKKVSGSFYKDFVNPKLNSPWPIICKKGEKIDTHENSLEMGCRRAQYGIYHRQFEFFCPLWLEQITPEDILKFKIDIYSVNDSTGSKRIISSKYLTLDLFEGQSFHNKFIKYFQEYCHSIGLDKGNDNILAVHLNKGVAQISGINVTNGLPVVKDLPHLVRNLLNRERPLMEFDSMLINEFKNNNLVAAQLFNINLCFNTEDLLTNSIQDRLMGKDFNISVTAYLNDKPLESKDFYSNYEYIRKKKCGPQFDDTVDGWEYLYELENVTKLDNGTYLFNGDILKLKDAELNVMNYLGDHKCLDIINDNKIVQNIIHWSLYDNNEYILNAYEGFSGYTEDPSSNKLRIDHSHLYDNTPNIHQKPYTPGSNNTSWCNWIVLSQDANLNTFGGNKVGWLRFASDFGQTWVNNIKYFDNCYYDDDIKDMKVLLVKLTADPEKEDITDEDVLPLENWFDENMEDCKINNNLWYTGLVGMPNVLFLISNRMDNLTYSNMLDELSEYFKKCKVLNTMYDQQGNVKPGIKKLISLFNKMKSADSSNNPPIISLKNTLISDKAKGPSLFTNEIEYYKKDNSQAYVLRYSGKVKPTFITPGAKNLRMFNFIYYKDYLSDDRTNGLSNYQKSPYALYSNSGLQPLYPSIEYYSTFKSLPIDNKGRDLYKSIPKILVGEHEYEVSLINEYEYPWYNDGKVLFLEKEMITTIAIKNMTREDFLTKVKEYLKEYYSLTDDKLVEYIYHLYKLESHLEYMQPAKGEAFRVNDYIYNIKLTLK